MIGVEKDRRDSTARLYSAGLLDTSGGVRFYLHANSTFKCWEASRLPEGSLELRVLRFGLLENRDVAVGLFPECEEVFVSGESTDAGGIGSRSLRGSRLQGIGPSDSQRRQRSRPAVPHDAVVIDNLLKLSRGGSTLSVGQVCLTTQVRRIQARGIHDEGNVAQLNERSSLQGVQGGGRVLSVQRQLRVNRRQPERLHLRAQRESLPQVLGQRFGPRRIARHGKRKRGFSFDALTRGSELQSFGCCLPRFFEIAVSRFPLSSNCQIDRPNLFIVGSCS